MKINHFHGFFSMNSKKKVLPFVGRNFSESGLSILVVGSQQFTTCLEGALSQCRLQGCSVQLHTHTCQSVHALLRLPALCALHFDFIVFAIDTRMADALASLRKDINSIDKHFLLMSRLCLVASDALAYEDMSILSERLQDEATKLHCPLLLGHVLEPSKCRSLAQRLLQLVSSVTGVRTGVPLLLARSERDSRRIDFLASDHVVFQ